MPAGRPAIWDDSEAFSRAVDEYFDNSELTHTWSGLALHLGFESRQSLEDYKHKDEFSYPIKKALLKIEQIYEQALFSKNAAGPIFALKNFGWKDTREVKHDIPRVFINMDPLADDTGDNSAKENSQA
jgi:hypothetical protein